MNDIKDLLEFCLEYSKGDGIAFFSFSGHVNQISIEFYKNKDYENNSKDNKKQYSSYLDRDYTDTPKEIIEKIKVDLKEWE